MPAILKTILSRTFVVYLACFFLIWRILNYQELINNAVPQTLSRLTPPIDYFTEFVDRTGHYDRFKLMDCVYYHQAVVNFYAYQRSEAYGMLGFCYERLGQEPQAVESYKQAIAINPYNFWPYYDLGVISYDHAQYAQAGDYLSKAIEQAPIKTIVLLARSKVYNDVRLSTPGKLYDYIQGLKQGRVKAYILLMDSLNKTGTYDQLLKTASYGLKEGLDTQGIFYYYAGVAAFNLKSYDKAFEFLQAAVQNDPNDAEAFLYLGMCLHAVGREDLAQVMMRKAASLHEEVSPIAPYLKAQVRFF